MGDERAATVEVSEVKDGEIRRFLAESLGRIREALDPQVLVFFGSRVSGHTDEWSDIDLFVVSDRFREMRVLARMELFHQVAQPHMHVDAICYTPEEFERMVRQPTLIREVMESGLRII